MQSLSQFFWTADRAYSPIGSAQLGAELPALIIPSSAGTARHFRVANEDSAVCEGSFCGNKGQRSLVATVEGFIERAALSQLANDDSLNATLLALGNGKPTATLLNDTPIGISYLEDASYRATASFFPRQLLYSGVGFNGVQNALLLVPHSFLSAGTRNLAMFSIFAPSISHGTWSGIHWTEYGNISAATLMPQIGNGNSLKRKNGLCDLLMAQNFARHMTTDALYSPDGGGFCTNGICDFLSAALGLDGTQYFLRIAPAQSSSEALEDHSPVGVFRRACVSGEVNEELAKSGVMPLARVMGIAAQYPSQGDLSIPRLSAFHMAAVNSCLVRVAKWGAFGWVNEFIDPISGEAAKRMQYPNQYATRQIIATCDWNATTQQFEAGYANSQAAWGNSVYEDEAKCKYSESGDDSATGMITWNKAFDRALFNQHFKASGAYAALLANGVQLHMNAQMPEDAENFADVRRADFGVMHLTAAQLLSALGTIANAAQGTFYGESGGGSVHAQKTFSACMPSTSDPVTATATGLDGYPCSFAVNKGYVVNNLINVFGIGAGEIYDTDHDTEPLVAPVSDFVNCFGSTASASALRVQNMASALRSIGASFMADVEAALSNAPIAGTVKTRADILNWINGFEYGDGTAQYIADIVNATKSQGQYEPLDDYFDLYFTCVQNGGTWEPDSLVNFFTSGTAQWADSAAYRWSTLPQNAVQYGALTGYNYMRKGATVSIMPNRAETKNDFSIYAKIRCWLGAVDWAWKGIAQ